MPKLSRPSSKMFGKLRMDLQNMSTMLQFVREKELMNNILVALKELEVECNVNRNILDPKPNGKTTIYLSCANHYLDFMHTKDSYDRYSVDRNWERFINIFNRLPTEDKHKFCAEFNLPYEEQAASS